MASQRGMAGVPRSGRHRWGGQRLGGVWRRWKRCLILGPFGTACLPWGPCVRAPPCDAFGHRLLRASSWAGAPGLPPQLTPEPPRPPRPVGPQRQSPRVLDDLTHEPPGFFQPLACLPCPGPGPQHTGRPLPPPHGPSWGRVRGHLLRHAGVQRLACHDRLQPRRRQGAQAEGFLQPLRRSGPRALRFLLTLYSRGAALLPPPAVRAARTCPTRARGVFNGARGVGRVADKDRAQGAQGARVRGAPPGMGEGRWASRLVPFQEGQRMGGNVLLASSRHGEASAPEHDATP